MNYAEEQAQELEALEAILMDDLQGDNLFYRTTRAARIALLLPVPPPTSGPFYPKSPRLSMLRIEFDGTRPDGWDSSCSCYSVVISPADDGASSPDPDELVCALPNLRLQSIITHLS